VKEQMAMEVSKEGENDELSYEKPGDVDRFSGEDIADKHQRTNAPRV
jgi:hypothetical protein